MTPDTILARTLPGAIRAVRAARRRVATLARQSPNASPFELLARVRAELTKVEPQLARVLTASTIAAWVSAARGLVRDAGVKAEAIAPGRSVQIPEFVGRNVPAATPGIPSIFAPGGTSGRPPARPVYQSAAPFPDPPPVRWPAVDAAVRDLMAREVLTAGEYSQLADEAKSTAFTVARVLTEDAVEKVRDKISETVERGKTLRAFRREVEPALAGSGLSDSQVEGVFRTQVGQAQGAGMRAVLDIPAVRLELPYLAYSATHDSRTRHNHLALERLGIQGTNIYRADDPVIRLFFPPWEWNCRCLVIPLSIEDAAAAGIREARIWLRTGIEPTPPVWVPMPPFAPPAGFGGGGGIRSVI